MTKKLPQEFLLFPPSQGIDNNWHVTDVNDTMVAHCYGFGHDLAGGEHLARRIAAALNYCRGMSTTDIEANKNRTPDPLLKLKGTLSMMQTKAIRSSYAFKSSWPLVAAECAGEAAGLRKAIQAVERLQKRIREN